MRTTHTMIPCRALLFAALLAGFASAQPSLLTPGSPVERSIEPGDAHAYRISIEAGQFVHVTAAQLGVDLTIQLTQPNGTKYASVDRLPYESFEDALWIAKDSGEWTVEVRCSKKSSSGRYRLELEVRPP